jgi:hypothetical protein
VYKWSINPFITSYLIYSHTLLNRDNIFLDGYNYICNLIPFCLQYILYAAFSDTEYLQNLSPKDMILTFDTIAQCVLPATSTHVYLTGPFFAPHIFFFQSWMFTWETMVITSKHILGLTVPYLRAQDLLHPGTIDNHAQTFTINWSKKYTSLPKDGIIIKDVIF